MNTRTVIAFGLVPVLGALALADSAEAQKRVYVGNLTIETTPPEVKDLFDDYGQVTSVHMQSDRSKRPRGFGFVEMQSELEAEEAVEGLDQSVYRGRILDVSFLPIPGYPALVDEAGAADERSSAAPAPDWTRLAELDRDGVSDVLDWMGRRLAGCEHIAGADRRGCVNDAMRYQTEVNNRIGRGINSTRDAVAQDQWIGLGDQLRALRTRANELR